MVESRVFVISKDEIMKGDILRLLLGIGQEAEKRGGISKIQGKISFQVSGYDNDPRELWEIPELKLYFKKIDETAPFFLYYIASELNAPIIRLFLKFFIYPHFFTTPSDKMPDGSFQQVENFIKKRFEKVSDYCKQISQTESKSCDPRETIQWTYKAMGIEI